MLFRMHSCRGHSCIECKECQFVVQNLCVPNTVHLRLDDSTFYIQRFLSPPWENVRDDSTRSWNFLTFHGGWRLLLEKCIMSFLQLDANLIEGKPCNRLPRKNIRQQISQKSWKPWVKKCHPLTLNTKLRLQLTILYRRH